jgi:hypothetical protein
VTSRLRPRLSACPLPLSLVGARLVEIAPASGPGESPVARFSAADLPADPLRGARGGLRRKRRAALSTSAARGHRASVAPAWILAAFPAARWITLRPPGLARSPGHVGHDPAAKWIRGTRPLKTSSPSASAPVTPCLRPTSWRAFLLCGACRHSHGALAPEGPPCAGTGHRLPVVPVSPMRRDEGLPGAWAVLFIRAAATYPAGASALSPFASALLWPSGLTTPWAPVYGNFEAGSPRPTCSRAYASPAALPSPSQGSLPAWWATPWPGGFRTRWTTYRIL